MTAQLTQQLDDALGDALRRFAPLRRRVLLRRLAKGLRDRQARRIRRQSNPNGSAMRPRQRATIKTWSGRMRFRWKGQKVREIVNWHNTRCRGHRAVTGYDVIAEDFRTFLREDIDEYLELEVNKTAIRRRLRKGAMFERLRTARYLRTGADSIRATVGFTGRTAAIAGIHQYGLRDDLDGHNGPALPQRQLLGFSDDDIAWLSDQLATYLASQ
ncbi:phage virion morphogenesis protein [Escherichia coli]|uniref:phage virion morphogenesis protein n=2 Tax=Escherichia coli TaxID=562 RepID=UPI00135F0404|nr:phage virion morphogenesis protein [Escherichia coli]MXF04489.1 phage virion morphogenesis protein [Escherichia coli]